MSIQTPCTKVCTVDPASRLCLGCARTLNEIARWTALTDAQRARIMGELPQRLALLAAAKPIAAKTGASAPIASEPA